MSRPHVSELRFDSSMHLDHARRGFHAADIDDFARTYPFAYTGEDRSDLARFIAPLSSQRKLGRWAANSCARTDRPTLASFSST
jgi:hypothetical protein